MVRAVKAGVVYVAIIFAIGFVLGAVRVTLVVPRIGALAAVCLEAPVLLGLAWIVCGRVVRRFGVEAAVGPRLVMGGVAFALLMLAELALSMLLGGRTPAQHLALYRALPEQVGLAAQIIFALFPLMQRGAAASRPR